MNDYYRDLTMSFVDISQLPSINSPPKENKRKSKSKSKSPQPKGNIEPPTSSNANVFDKNNVIFSQLQNFIKATEFNIIPSKSNDFLYEATISQYEDQSILRTLNNIITSKTNKNYATIYKIHSTGYMVEQTYYRKLELKPKELLEEETCFLTKVINGWRRVAGDGNCFYRSVMYSWLEYLVFETKIDILRYIVIDIGMNMNKNIHPSIKSKYTHQPTTAITILNRIIEQLSDNRIKNAYTTLFYAFQFKDKSFDLTMIMYLRYLLYKFINENKHKCFSQEFPVLLGNLLPAKFEDANGNFLFDNYFVTDLLKLYTCAEKIAVFITPYVLKINLNIVMYDYSDKTDIQTKLFKCPLDDKGTITILFRNGHYDVCYTNQYRDKYQEYLKMFAIHDEGGFFIMEQEDIDNLNDKLEILGIKLEGSKVYNYDKIRKEIDPKIEELETKLKKEEELKKEQEQKQESEEQENELKNNINVKDK